MQLSRAAVVVGVLASGPAAADELTVRGAYYKERATRVVQPMLDASVDVGEAGVATGHFLADAITSASAATGAAGVPFTETRYEAGGGYTHTRGRWQLGGNARVSYEPDYQSVFALARAQRGFAEDNLVLGAAVGYGHDRVTNAGAQGPFSEVIEGALDGALASLSATQVLGETAVASLTYDLGYQAGYLQNPYRVVVATGGTAAERHPASRLRHAVAASSRWYWRGTGSTWIASYRLYVDDWGLVAHTPELRWSQAAGEAVEFGLRYRLHVQGAADFYQEMYEVTAPEIEPYLSADEKLAAFTNHTVEARLAVLGEALGAEGRWAGARAETLLQYVVQGNDFGNAIVGMLALTVPLEGE